MGSDAVAGGAGADWATCLSLLERVRMDPKVLRRVSRILIKKGLHFANLFYIFE